MIMTCHCMSYSIFDPVVITHEYNMYQLQHIIYIFYGYHIAKSWQKYHLFIPILLNGNTDVRWTLWPMSLGAEIPDGEAGAIDDVVQYTSAQRYNCNERFFKVCFGLEWDWNMHWISDRQIVGMQTVSPCHFESWNHVFQFRKPLTMVFFSCFWASTLVASRKIQNPKGYVETNCFSLRKFVTFSVLLLSSWCWPPWRIATIQMPGVVF